jgi:hypothetical protein
MGGSRQRKYEKKRGKNKKQARKVRRKEKERQ